jgi:AcrR family transcriptional regulator
MAKAKGARAAALAPPDRRSPGRPPVQKDRIIDAALRIVDAEGADELSMRLLAQRLNSGTATLYRHFANRGEVVAHVVDRVFGEATFDVEQLRTMTWQEACRTVARGMFDALRRHRNVASLLVEHAPRGPNAMAQRELLINILLENQFAPQLAARCYATLARYVLGFAIQTTETNASNDTDDVSFASAFDHSDPERFPAIATVAEHLPVALDDEFTFGLDMIMAGLTQINGGDNPGTQVHRA